MSVRLTVLPSGVVAPVRPGRTILEAAEDAGLRLPYGCRYGACLNCAARLLAGDVVMPSGTALADDLVAKGVFLACVAEARSDCTIEVGTGGMGVLAVSPWSGGG